MRGRSGLWGAALWMALCLASVHVGAVQMLLVLGDSLSAGYGMARGQAWPSLLAMRLQQERLPFTVANASVSGETTAGGLRRIGAALAQHRPAVVLSTLGVNDGLRGHSIDAMRKNLYAMIEACRRSDAQVVLIGTRLPPAHGQDYAESFHQMYFDIARRHQVSHVPFLLERFAEHPAWFLVDRAHPAPHAQPLMLDMV